MAYKIGTRVRKVAGNGNIGATGIVCDGPCYHGFSLDQINAQGPHVYDGFVKFDRPCVGEYGYSLPAGVWAVKISNWTPITPDGHRAGVKGECSLLDELLSREVKNEAV